VGEVGAALGVAAALITVIVALASPAPAVGHTLTYSKAKRAVQKRADAHAHTRTRVNALIRQSRHWYYAQAKWTRTDPDGCKGCGYDPATGQTYDTPTTEKCFVEISVRFKSKRSRKTVARVKSSGCF
jgi:hypothetical protein